MHFRIFLIIAALVSATPLSAETGIALIDSAEDWSFNNGSEFPGATGSLTLEPGARNEAPALKLVGDFTGGGGYVQAGRNLPDSDIRELSMRVKNP